MFCSQCGTEAQATAKFCQKCGTPFTKHFLPTQPNELAVEKAHAPQNHAATEAVPVRPTPQPRPEHTPRQASPSRSESPALWNPSAAASWSLLFTPVFGAYLHMRNWEELGEPEKAKSSKTWFYISFFFSIFGLLYLLIWYFASGKEQMAYVKERYGDNYNKKSWGAPIMAGIGIVVVFYVLGTIGGLFVEKAMQPRHSAANAIQQQPNPFADPNFGAPDYTPPPKSEAKGGNPYLDPNYDGTPWSGGDYTPKKSWTQENTNSREIGPWLNYAPTGTMFCRLPDGNIATVHPPGVKPNAQQLSQFCADHSVSSPQQL